MDHPDVLGDVWEVLSFRLEESLYQRVVLSYSSLVALWYCCLR